MVFIASDHAGFAIKDAVKTKIQSLGLEVHDLGPTSEERVDYPDYADQVCLKIKENPQAFGVLICGSGQGMAMRANKYSFIRAALCWNEESALLARQHNNANIICVGSRLLEKETVDKILDTFFKQTFEGGRHERRVNKISQPTG